ncbi:MAG: transketolase [Ignavibacteria bacterium]|nr:transketolase [Ignavibacteria bacterium]
MPKNNIHQLSINTIRCLTIDAIQKANSGHPGMPMGCAPIAYMLYTKIMKHNPDNPGWLNRDRFILSAGHGSMLLYSILHLCGYKITLDDIKSFRQWKSITAGHPEHGLVPGVETTTGPLGQGFANAVGMGIAQEYLGAMFKESDKKILDHYVYGICSDGDIMEGISHEAASLAGHYKLGKLIFFYDDNGITIDGKTSLTFSDDVEKRFLSYGWQVLQIDDVNDLDQIENAVDLAQSEKRKPSLIITRTHIGFGSPNKQDTAASHGAPLGEEEVKLTKQKLDFPEDVQFYVPEEVYLHFKEIKNNLLKDEKEWNNLFESYKKNFPKEAQKFLDYMQGNFGNEWINELPQFIDYNEKLATRKASGKILNAIAQELPTLIGGSADLSGSNNTVIKDNSVFSFENYSGRNFHFGIREHAMTGICNGLALYGGIIPYCGTFLIFSDYMRPSIRLAALMKLNPIYIFTHDSIGLGEDGPTHQPVEQLSSLRTIPGLIVIRPADANETVYAWKAALQHKDGPSALILTRQKIPILDRTKLASAKETEKGAYIILDPTNEPDILIMASGSEVFHAIETFYFLQKEGINARIVSFPSWELFEMQTADYKESVFPPSLKARISIETGVKQGWEKYLGDYGEAISIEKFGTSAPYNVLFNEYGFTVENIVKHAHKVLNKIVKE